MLERGLLEEIRGNIEAMSIGQSGAHNDLFRLARRDGVQLVLQQIS